MGYINESVIYNIYPLGFCGAPKENDFKQEYRLDKIYGWILLIIKKSTVCSVTTNLSKKFAKHFTITASELCLTAFLIMWEEISLLSKMFSRTVKIQDMRLGLKI